MTQPVFNMDRDIAEEDFEALLEESFSKNVGKEGQVVPGTIIRREGDYFIVDVGLKSEGLLPVSEFFEADGKLNVGVGDRVDVYLEKREDQNGEAVLSREKARREEAWINLEKAYESKEIVQGTILGKVKGGYTVDLDGLYAFLPGSQVDVRPLRDISRLQNERQPFEILKMDRRRGNIVVSRRSIIERHRESARKALVENLHENMILDGVVKNITDYGAFVDLGGLDGLLHITDMSWKRVKHPSEVVSVGDTVTVQVIKFNRDTQRISLGIKQLLTDPWEGIGAKYPVGARFKGVVTNITDYGAFVELEPGVEGLVHVSEMSWSKKNLHPSKVLDVNTTVEVMILDVDADKRRVSLGLKQCMENPWQAFADQHPVGSNVSGEVKNITEFGIFVGLSGDIDGLVHLSDVTWEQSEAEGVLKGFQKGQQLFAIVLSVDPEKERISLGLKQLQNDGWSDWVDAHPKGIRIDGEVVKVKEREVVVQLADKVMAVLPKAEFSRTRREENAKSYEVGNRLEAKITQIDRQNRKIELSVRALEISEEREAIREYTSSDKNRTTLGDILSEALERNASGNSDAS